MLRKILLASVVVFATQNIIAEASSDPSPCPSVKSFTNVGIKYVVKKQTGEWYGIEWNNKFDTENEWTMVVGPFKAYSVSSALASANSLLDEMIFRQVSAKNETTKCEYSDATRIFSVSAVTPATFPNYIINH